MPYEGYGIGRRAGEKQNSVFGTKDVSIAEVLRACRPWIAEVMGFVQYHESRRRGELLLYRSADGGNVDRQITINMPDNFFFIVSCERSRCKGNTRIRYEFGQKAAVVKTNSGNWIVNVEDLPNNP